MTNPYKHYWEVFLPDTPKEVREKHYIGNIWKNQAKCLSCLEVIISNNRHDFVTCSCGNLSVDGGSFYTRRLFQTADSWEEMSLYYDDVE